MDEVLKISLLREGRRRKRERLANKELIDVTRLEHIISHAK
jgi:hypothetical protein